MVNRAGRRDGEAADDCLPAAAVTDEAEIRLVRIELAVEVERRGEDPARQKLATDVYSMRHND